VRTPIGASGNFLLRFQKIRNWTNQQSQTAVSDKKKNSAPLGLVNLALPCKQCLSSIETTKNYDHLPLTKNGDHLVVANKLKLSSIFLQIEVVFHFPTN
jgi:hypothetical protein